MTFDQTFDRLKTRSSKWTALEDAFGLTGEDLLPMWVADMDFLAPDFLTRAVRDLAEAGDFGYFNHTDSYLESVAWWATTRHGWKIEPGWITPAASLGNAIAFAIQTWSKPGDGVAIFSPVYHEFSKKIRKNGRTLTELPLREEDGRFTLDFDRFDTMMCGTEKILILSSPHNPGGRVWSPDELRAIADFAERHDLILISDEVHNDLILPGYSHQVTALAAPEISPRLVTMTSASKTFSIAGSRLGAVIIADARLRGQFTDTVSRADLYPNLLGIALSRAAFSPEGAAWVDALLPYLAANFKAFRSGLETIPGALVHRLEGTYLTWVDFSGTGMTDAELWARATGQARVVPSPGPAFGTGGSGGLRFNLGTQRARIDDAVDRLTRAFADLQ
jgi:cystathionine beta-lyase